MQKLLNIPSIFPVTCHTDFVGPDTIFVVINGFSKNGIEFVPLAIKKGARTIIVENSQTIPEDIDALIKEYNVVVQRVANTRLALATMSAKAAGNPAEKLIIVGITGTKGKTTTSFLVHHLLTSAGFSTALISTVKNRIFTTDFKAPLTTPQPDYIHQFLKVCIEHNVTHVVMEVAAQAITMHRVDGIQFDAIAITNIEREHLEFYGTMEKYIAAKLEFLQFRKPHAKAWINADDPLLKTVKGHNLKFFSIQKDADMQLHDCSTAILQAELFYNGSKSTIECPTLFGSYNLSNIAAASGICFDLGVSLEDLKKGLQSVSPIPGRYEMISLSNGARAVIDYAHNPLSFKQVLPVLRSQTDHLIVVFGAGGDRDFGRRPLMGALATEYADHVVITSDNPRSEDPKAIAQQIVEGIPVDRNNYSIELDREKAIHLAYKMARPGSVIALLGKGPDEYQIIGSQTIVFKERDIVSSLS